MVVVASIWEEGWNTPIKELDLWYYPLQDFNVDEFAMTPISGIFTDKVQEFHSVDHIIRHYDIPIVICDERGENNLVDFKHPADVMYLFSRTSKSLMGNYDYPTLKIPTPNNKGTLWGHQAASIILYDRYIKNGNIVQ